MSSPATPAKVADELRSTTARLRDEMVDRGPRGTEISEDVAEFWLSGSRVLKFGFHRFRSGDVEAFIRGWVNEGSGRLSPMGAVGLNLRLVNVLDFAHAFAKILDRLEVDSHGRVTLKPAAPASPAGGAAARAPVTAGTSACGGANGSTGAIAPAAATSRSQPAP